jgi:hypothetical protein
MTTIIVKYNILSYKRIGAVISVHNTWVFIVTTFLELVSMIECSAQSKPFNIKRYSHRRTDFGYYYRDDCY